jgi:hypothetical protein
MERDACIQNAFKRQMKEGSFTRDSKGYAKALEMGVCFHRGHIFGGTWMDTPFLGPVTEGKNFFY